MRCRRWRPASAIPRRARALRRAATWGRGVGGSAGSPHGTRRAVISRCRRGYRAGIVTLPPVSGRRRWLPALAPIARRVRICAAFRGRADGPEFEEELGPLYTAADAYNHSPEQIRGFFGDLDLISPGLVDAGRWRPGWAPPLQPRRKAMMLAGVAHKRT